MCLTPVTLRLEHCQLGQQSPFIQVPCGRCVECVMAYQRSWSIRMIEEFKTAHRQAVFVTLTYNNDNVPLNYFYDGKVWQSKPQYNLEFSGRGHNKKKETADSCLPESVRGKAVPFSWAKRRKWYEFSDEVNNALENNLPISFPSVRKADVQLFIKRIRKKTDKKFTYFLTSEYGPATNRPHYHAVFFGISEWELRPLLYEWKRDFGFYDAQTVGTNDMDEEGAMKYCSKYCSKGSFENPWCSRDAIFPQEDGTFKEYHYKTYYQCENYFGINEPIVDKTFRLVSKGLGSGYLNYENIKHHIGELADKLVVHTRDLINKAIRNNNYVFKGKTLPLPRYYKQKIFSDALRAEMSVTLRNRDDEVYRTTLGNLSSADDWRTDIQTISNYEVSQFNEKKNKYRRNFEILNNNYMKSKL